MKKLKNIPLFENFEAETANSPVKQNIGDDLNVERNGKVIPTKVKDIKKDHIVVTTENKEDHIAKYDDGIDGYKIEEEIKTEENIYEKDQTFYGNIPLFEHFEGEEEENIIGYGDEDIEEGIGSKIKELGNRFLNWLVSKFGKKEEITQEDKGVQMTIDVDFKSELHNQLKKHGLQRFDLKPESLIKAFKSYADLETLTDAGYLGSGDGIGFKLTLSPSELWKIESLPEFEEARYFYFSGGSFGEEGLETLDNDPEFDKYRDLYTVEK